MKPLRPNYLVALIWLCVIWNSSGSKTIKLPRSMTSKLAMTEWFTKQYLDVLFTGNTQHSPEIQIVGK